MGRFLPLRDARGYVERKVNLLGVILDYGFPKPTMGTDDCCPIRIIDETHHQTGMAVNIFDREEKLPLAAVGDIILLQNVVVKLHVGEVNAVFSRISSTFALYKGKDGDSFVPYKYSTRFKHRDGDNMLIDKLRKWLVNFQLREDLSNFSMLSESKKAYSLNLACKILHCEAANGECFVFAWDGTDTPSNPICSKLGDEINSPLSLQLEPVPLPRELLCTFPAVGSILRITFELGFDKKYLPLLNVGKWVKFINVRLEVDDGLWLGVFTPFSKIRYAPDGDCLIVERQRLSDERLSLKLGKLSSCWPSCLTEVNQDHAAPVTLMSVLSQTEVTAKFKCVVRVVAAMPCLAENFLSPAGTYRMRLTLEDPTARIHALVNDKDGETLFDGYPGIDKLTRKLNRLLGVAECDAPRNPPWIAVCLESYCHVSNTDVWGSRHFRIFDTKIVEDA